MKEQKTDLIFDGMNWVRDNHIVNECIKAIQMTMSRSKRDDYYRGQYDAITTIKKRFNIEE